MANSGKKKRLERSQSEPPDGARRSSSSRLRSRKKKGILSIEPPPRYVILPYMPQPLLRGNLETTIDEDARRWQLAQRLLSSALFEPPRALGSWRPNPWKGPSYGAGAEQKAAVIEKEEKSARTADPTMVSTWDSLMASTKSSMGPIPPDPQKAGAGGSPADDLKDKYGAVVDTDTHAFSHFEFDLPNEDAVKKALAKGALSDGRNCAQAFLRDRSRHIVTGLGPLYQQSAQMLASVASVAARGEDGGDDVDEEEDDSTLHRGAVSGNGKHIFSPTTDSLARSIAERHRLPGLQSQHSDEAEIGLWRKSYPKQQKYLGETYYTAQSGGVRDSHVNTWVPRSRKLLGPREPIREHYDEARREARRQDEGHSQQRQGLKKTLWRGALNKRDVAARSQQAQVQMGANGGFMTTDFSGSWSAPAVKIWRESEESWISHSLKEASDLSTPKQWDDDSHQRGPTFKKKQLPKRKSRSIIGGRNLPSLCEEEKEGEAPIDTSTWALEALATNSYTAKAKDLRKDALAGKTLFQHAAGKESLHGSSQKSASGRDMVDIIMPQPTSKQRFVGPWGGPLVKEEYIPPNRGASCLDNEDEGPAEWKGMDKNWLRQRLTLTH